MKSAFWIFVAALCIGTAWGLGYRTGTLDADAEIYARGFDDGYETVAEKLR